MSTYKIWESCENYLNVKNSYSINQEGSNGVVIYKSKNNQSTLQKIAKVVSYCLLLPPIISFLIRQIFREFCSYRIKPIEIKPKIGFSDCDVIPTKNCLETDVWRKKLISVAQHNIVISGNYCAGHAFDELLQAIDLRMSQVPKLQTVIIAHPKFIKDNKKEDIRNRKLLKTLMKRYPRRFTLVDSPDGAFTGKRITNHTKCTVIDYGRYFIQGGSGIKDNFASVALLGEKVVKKAGVPITRKDDLSLIDEKIVTNHPVHKANGKKVVKKVITTKAKDDLDLPKKSQKQQTHLMIKDDSVISSLKIKKVSGNSFIESFLPGAFRDQDFVFKCKGDSNTGKRVYREALFLALKWDQYKKKGQLSSDSWDLDKIDDNDQIFTDYPALSANGASESIPVKKKEKSSSSLQTLLKTQIPDSIEEKGSRKNVEDFNSNKINDVGVKTFFTGPEDLSSDWEENLVKRIQQAEKRIVIDHMYFQPSSIVMNALIEAANRNVDISIITAGGGKHAPNGEKFFGHRNLYNLHYLFSSIIEKSNLHMYLFTQAKNGLHKKVVVIDDYVLAGSSNMGTKSLILTGDHEMNFEAKSKKLAKATLEIIEVDKKHSKKLKDIKLTLKDRVAAAFHSMGANFWG